LRLRAESEQKALNLVQEKLQAEKKLTEELQAKAKSSRKSAISIWPDWKPSRRCVWQQN
jgi:hypothetical protein